MEVTPVLSRHIEIYGNSATQNKETKYPEGGVGRILE
jgi:hypothetical protein